MLSLHGKEQYKKSVEPRDQQIPIAAMAKYSASHTALHYVATRKKIADFQSKRCTIGEVKSKPNDQPHADAIIALQGKIQYSLIL